MTHYECVGPAGSCGHAHQTIEAAAKHLHEYLHEAPCCGRIVRRVDGVPLTPEETDAVVREVLS